MDLLFAGLFCVVLIPGMFWLFLRTYIAIMTKEYRTKWLSLTFMFFYIVHIVARYYNIDIYAVPL